MTTDESRRCRELLIAAVEDAKGIGFRNGVEAAATIVAQLKERVAKLETAAKAMLKLEAQRMYERDMDDDAKVRPCPCHGCVELRAAVGAP